MNDNKKHAIGCKMAARVLWPVRSTSCHVLPIVSRSLYCLSGQVCLRDKKMHGEKLQLVIDQRVSEMALCSIQTAKKQQRRWLQYKTSNFAVIHGTTYAVGGDLLFELNGSRILCNKKHFPTFK